MIDNVALAMPRSAPKSAEPTVTLTVWTFSLTFVETRHSLGVAMVCPEARYAGVYWMDQRVERRHLTGSMWTSVEADLKEGFDPGAVSKARPVARVLSGSRGAVLDVEYLRHRSIAFDAAAVVADVLDKMVQTEDSVRTD